MTPIEEYKQIVNRINVLDAAVELKRAELEALQASQVAEKQALFDRKRLLRGIILSTPQIRFHELLKKHLSLDLIHALKQQALAEYDKASADLSEELKGESK